MKAMPAKQGIKFQISTDMDVKVAVLNSNKYIQTEVNDATFAQRLATVVSELATNIVKYAHNGSVSLSFHKQVRGGYFEIQANDRGPGIANKEQALSDGYSASGTLGLGLPGIKRMVDEFILETTVGKGTRITVRKFYPPRS